MGNIFVSPTADDIANAYNLNGKVAIVTGATNGIGYETTKTLVRCGSIVILACRDRKAGMEAKRRILDCIGERFEPGIRISQLDLSSFSSIKQFVDEFETTQLPLHYLVLNAATLGGPYRLTKEGFEAHFGVNYLGHFFLTQLLLSRIHRRAQPNPPPLRIVAVCCSPPRKVKLRPGMIGNTNKQKYSFYKAYDQSKLALRYFAEELSMRMEGSPVEVVGADPGITMTRIIRKLNPIILSFLAFAAIFMKTPAQGAATIVFACLDRRISSKVKPFCVNCRLCRYNNMKSRYPGLREIVYQESEALIKNARIDSCTSEAFSPKTEAWRAVSRAVEKMLKNRRKSLSRDRSYELTTATSYKKLD